MNESVEQIDPTEVLSVEVVKRKAARGAAILTIRTIILQLISFFANILLTIFLEPVQYGVFFLVSALINFLAYFSDVGFAAALIQKKESLTKDDLRTIFTAQQALIIFLIIVIFLISPIVQAFYKFNQESIYLLWALTFSLFVSSLKTIPSVLMERRLDFNKLVIPQIVETIVFYTVAVFLAFRDFGVSSFTIAVLARSVCGLVATYIIQPWMPSIAFSWHSFRSILKFGIPYQTNVFLAMIKDDGMTIFLGSILGAQAVGLLGWAQKWAYAPLRFFMDQVIKVTFPAFSRMQDNKKQLSDTVSKSIFFICLLVFPTIILLVFLGPPLTQVIPKYNKWEPALTALMLIAITSAFAAVTTPLTNMLNAIGKISLTFKFMVMWTILTWVLVPILSIMYGVNGAALGFALVGLSSVLVMWQSQQFVYINYFKSVGKPILGCLVMSVIIALLRLLLPLNFIFLIIITVTGIVSYLLILIGLEPGLPALIKTTLKDE